MTELMRFPWGGPDDLMSRLMMGIQQRCCTFDDGALFTSNTNENNELVTKVGLPGVPKENISITRTGTQLSIEYKVEETSENSQFVKTGGFDMTLNEDVDPKISWADGVVTIVEKQSDSPEKRTLELE